VACNSSAIRTEHNIIAPQHWSGYKAYPISLPTAQKEERTMADMKELTCVIAVRMLSSLDRDESQNFSLSQVSRNDVRPHTVHLNDAKHLIARSWVTGWAPRERQRQLPLKYLSWVACTITVFYDALSVFSKHLFTCTCTLSPVLTPVTVFHCTATTAYIISDCNWQWQAAYLHQ